jgi:terminal uridylyltransferase
MTDQNAPIRPAVVQPRIYNPGSDRRLGDPNSHSLHDVNQQCLYLKFLADRETNKELNERELLEKESFRKKLERIVQQLIAVYAKDNVISISPKNIRLKCYGSLASGFAVPGSDMDLLLMFPKDQGPVGSIEIESRRMIEKEFLDCGYGARLLTKTRVPILRVCQNPNPELLAALRKERRKWEEEIKEDERERLLLASGLDPSRLPADLTHEQSDAATVTFAELDTEPSIIPLPPSPARAHADLEYKNGVGIQCDINFSNYVAIHNTALLRCYCKCDPRVRPMGLFVKAWSKARKINTPYHGTLSSYGYIMMVLHYLMNIAQPPVIPNLQHLARDEDAWNNRTDIELFEGFDIRFIRDEAMLERRAHAGQMTKNRESLGSLIRGFFRYYTDSRGFHWLNDVISIRTQGGLLTKKSKDWTEAKRAGKDNSVKLRYIFAIEDPFETDHNIARTVGHSGIVAIRGELRRAWDILSKVKNVEGRWLWYKDDGEEGEDLFSQANDRGDLLRQDQDFYREKMKKLKESERKREAEMKSAEGDKGASAESVDGRFSKPSQPSGFHDDAHVSNPRSGRVESKLIMSGPVLQNLQARKENTPPSIRLQVSKDGVNREISPDLTHSGSKTKDAGFDISKWIQSTAEASRSPRIDAGAIEKTGSGATVDRKSSQRTTELKEKIVNLTGAATNSALGSSTDHSAPVTKSAVCLKTSAPANATNATKRSLTIDPQNPLSAWNMALNDGRWLVWRDEKVRKGTWMGISCGPFSILNRQYPYNAARPLPDFGQQNRLANVRAKRNQYFKLNGVGAQAVDIEAFRGNQSTDQERKDSAISIDKPSTLLDRKFKPSPQSGSSKPDVKHSVANGKNNTKAPSTSDFTLALSSNNPEVIHNPRCETDATPDNSLVPPHDPDPHDYRHDFPVPSIPGFQFDPAQLRDLVIIAKGGSGCARDVMEQQYGAYDYDGFRNVELSNEWGGGGRMGEMVTDSGELPIPESSSAKMKTDGSVNRGDEERVLRELPGDW